MLNPILAFSATRRMRSFRTLLIAGAYTLVMLAAAVLTMFVLFREEVPMSQLSSGVRCYSILMVLQFFLLVLIAPAMTSGAVAGERERQTLDLLLVTETRAFRLITGKVAESLAVLALLLVCGFPAVCLTLLSGAVTLTQLLIGELFLLAMAFAAVSLGVLASTLCRSTVASGVVAYLLLILVAVITTVPLFFAFTDEMAAVVYDQTALARMSTGKALSMVFPTLLANPFLGLLFLLHGQTGILSSLMEYRDTGRLLCGFMLLNRVGGETVALICTACMTALGALLMPLSALILRKKTGC